MYDIIIVQKDLHKERLLLCDFLHLEGSILTIFFILYHVYMKHVLVYLIYLHIDFTRLCFKLD